MTVDQKKQNLAIGVKNYKLDLCCIQETKIKVGSDINIGECRLITFSADVQHYGTGFIVAKKWANNISKYWKVSELIAYRYSKREALMVGIDKEDLPSC